MSDTSIDREACLSVLAQAPAPALKDFVDDLLPQLGEVEVLRNRSGLVMLPMAESVTGEAFYLGEVLVAEALVRVSQHEGYGACLGRDLEQALALALLDAANAGGLLQERIRPFVEAQALALQEQDDRLLRQVEATRVEMETF